MNDNARKQSKRIEITHGDPFVRDSQRNLKAKSLGKAAPFSMQERRIARKMRDEMISGRDMRVRRRGSSILGVSFAIFATIIFFSLKFTSPSIIVLLDGGEGEVFIDGNFAGKTGEQFRSLSPGKHEIHVVPSDSTRYAVPASRLVTLTYGISSKSVRVNMVIVLKTI